MKLSHLIEKLGSYQSFHLINNVCNPEIADIHFISPGDSCDKLHTLYVGIVQNAQTIVPATSILTFDKCKFAYEHINMLYLDSTDIYPALNQIQALLLEQQKNEVAFSHILSLLVHRNPLHDAVNMASTFLSRSLVITDLSFKVIDYSTDTPVTDPLWISNIGRGYCSREFISAISELLPLDAMPSDESPFPVNCGASTENKLCSCLMYEGHHIGYLILLDNEKGLLPYHYEYLPRIASLFVEFLRMQPGFDNYLTGVIAGILINMLEGEDPQSCKQRLFATRWDFPSAMRCFIFVPENTSTHTQAFLEKCLNELFPTGQIFSYGMFVIALLSADGLSIIQNLSLTDDILCYSNEIGVSIPFNDIADFPNMFRQSACACHLSHQIPNEGKLCMYEEYRFYDLLHSCSDKTLLEQNIHSSFGILNAYDLKKNSTLLNTLKCFLSNDMNAKKTADELFLHRNTLKYRLDKIQDLTGINFDDPETKFQLELSSRINLLLNKY